LVKNPASTEWRHSEPSSSAQSGLTNMRPRTATAIAISVTSCMPSRLTACCSAEHGT